MSALFIIWSVSAFVLEVPSGAWADVVDRRRLLIASAAILSVAFASWTVWPTFAGFATGFVLWSLSGALMSGTFEALLYDELNARRETGGYARVLSWCHAGELVAYLVASLLAAPLFVAGGYALVAWASVGVAVLHGVLAWSLPTAPPVESGDETKDAPGNAVRRGLLGRYLAMLGAGVREATRHPPVRRLVVITAVLAGLTAFDEYFGVIARELGASTATVPLLVAVTAAGQLAGTLLAGQHAVRSRWAMTAIVAASGMLIATGALSGHAAGFAAIAAGYGLLQYAIVISEARLQDTITGPARATVTSCTGLAKEVGAVLVFVAFIAGAGRTSFATVLALCCLPALGIAAAVRRWWPRVT